MRSDMSPRSRSSSRYLRDFVYDLSMKDIIVRGDVIVRIMRGLEPLPSFGATTVYCHTNHDTRDDVMNVILSLPDHYGRVIIGDDEKNDFTDTSIACIWYPPGSFIERRVIMIFMTRSAQHMFTGPVNESCFLEKGVCRAVWILCMNSAECGNYLYEFNPIMIAQLEDSGVLLCHDSGSNSIEHQKSEFKKYNYNHVQYIKDASQFNDYLSIYITGYYTRRVRKFYRELAQRGIVLDSSKDKTSPITITYDDIISGNHCNMYELKSRSAPFIIEAVRLASHYSRVMIDGCLTTNNQIIIKWTIPGLSEHNLNISGNESRQYSHVRYLPTSGVKWYRMIVRLGEGRRSLRSSVLGCWGRI